MNIFFQFVQYFCSYVYTKIVHLSKNFVYLDNLIEYFTNFYYYIFTTFYVMSKASILFKIFFCRILFHWYASPYLDSRWWAALGFVDWLELINLAFRKIGEYCFSNFVAFVGITLPIDFACLNLVLRILFPWPLKWTVSVRSVQTDTFIFVAMSEFFFNYIRPLNAPNWIKSVFRGFSISLTNVIQWVITYRNCLKSVKLWEYIIWEKEINWGRYSKGGRSLENTWRVLVSKLSGNFKVFVAKCRF